MPLEAGSAFPIPDLTALTARVLDVLRPATDAKAARAWLYTILRNEHARLYERQRPDVYDPSDLPDLPVRGYDTSAEAFVMRRALAELESDYRDPLLLQVIGGFSCKEIGEMLELNTNTVLTRLFRARRALRERLTDQPQQEANR